MIILRSYDFKIVCVILIVFFSVSTVMIMFHADCIGNTANCLPIMIRKSLILRINHKYANVLTPLAQVEKQRLQNFRSWNQAVFHSNPMNWPGEMGSSVSISPEEEKLKEEKFKINQFNILASDKIALNRTLSDVRERGCKNKLYFDKLPTTSIVIVFHNEAWSTLFRTVYSVIRMSPKELVEEIILVDDASEREYLKQPLEEYVSKLDVPVKVIRTGQRSGLIQARLIGATAVKGQVITFLDSHCECTIGWLEPLLDRIAENRSRVVCPVIDVISDTNFQHIAASGMTWGGFNWRMQFRWYRVSNRENDRRKGDRTLPVRTPTMAGGLFSIDKDYFKEIGTYDEGMKIWGGENLELSFRIWLCGGTLEIVPCSHVGHVFRKSTPYTFPGGTTKIVNHNNARLVEVWLDEWKDFFYAVNPVSINYKTDVTERKELRKRLQCKSFKWYLENIYPESMMPLDYYYLGEIKNEITNMCLDTLSRKNGENVSAHICHGLGGNQLFLFTKRKQIISNENCLEAISSHESVKLMRCRSDGGSQFWEYNKQKKAIIHVITDKCLDKTTDNNILLRDCDGRISQKWIMHKTFKWQIS